MHHKAPLAANSTPHQKFNYNFDRLLELLSTSVLDQKQDQKPDQELVYFREELNSVIRINYKIPTELFVKVIQNHIPHIMQRDDQYFLSINYDELVENPKYLKVIKKIIQIWTSTVNDTLKKSIGKYMELLLCYGIQATKRHDLLDILNQYRKTPLLID